MVLKNKVMLKSFLIFGFLIHIPITISPAPTISDYWKISTVKLLSTLDSALGSIKKLDRAAKPRVKDVLGRYRPIIREHIRGIDRADSGQMVTVTQQVVQDLGALKSALQRALSANFRLEKSPLFDEDITRENFIKRFVDPVLRELAKDPQADLEIRLKDLKSAFGGIKGLRSEDKGAVNEVIRKYRGVISSRAREVARTALERMGPVLDLIVQGLGDLRRELEGSLSPQFKLTKPRAIAQVTPKEFVQQFVSPVVSSSKRFKRVLELGRDLIQPAAVDLAQLDTIIEQFKRGTITFDILISFAEQLQKAESKIPQNDEQESVLLRPYTLWYWRAHLDWWKREKFDKDLYSGNVQAYMKAVNIFEQLMTDTAENRSLLAQYKETLTIAQEHVMADEYKTRLDTFIAKFGKNTLNPRFLKGYLAALAKFKTLRYAEQEDITRFERFGELFKTNIQQLIQEYPQLKELPKRRGRPTKPRRPVSEIFEPSARPAPPAPTDAPSIAPPAVGPPLPSRPTVRPLPPLPTPAVAEPGVLGQIRRIRLRPVEERVRPPVVEARDVGALMARAMDARREQIRESKGEEEEEEEWED